MKKILFGLALATLTFTSLVANADPLADREAAMKANGKAVGALVPIVKGEAPFDAAVVAAGLALLNDSAKSIDTVAMFPDNLAGESGSPKIWEDKPGFTAAMDKFKADTAAAAAAPATDLAAFQAQFGEVTKNCGTCHETYRIKKG
jgi:cytochrome c556